MRISGPQDRADSGRRSPWPGVITIGCLLVILLATLAPRSRHNRSDSGRANDSQGTSAHESSRSASRSSPLRRKSGAAATLTAKEIVAGKVSQFAQNRREIVHALAKQLKAEVPEEVERFFDAVEAGRWEEADALFKSMSARRTTAEDVPGLRALWPAIVETYGVTQQAHNWPAQRLLDYGNAVLDSLRPGMVYIGGTDAGRFIPTLLNETSDGDHHIILTQNALADGTYLDYVRFLYGDQMATLTPEDSQRAFSDYLADATKRLQHDQQFPDEPKQIRPGEDVRMIDGRVQVQGQVAVMGINELLVQMLMQKNPNAAFALQESYPLKSTYANATALGPIMELGVADAQNALTADRAAESIDYWRTTTQPLLSDPETPDTSDPRRAYSKLVLAQANLFLDHNYAAQAEEAFRFANDLAPAYPEAVFSYSSLLINQNRFTEARQLAETALRFSPGDQQFQNLLQALNNRK